MSEEPERKVLRLSVIKKPAENTRSVIVYDGEGTVVMRGDANVDFTCGGCRAVILEGIYPSQVQNLVFRCNGCGCYNETVN